MTNYSPSEKSILKTFFQYIDFLRKAFKLLLPFKVFVLPSCPDNGKLLESIADKKKKYKYKPIIMAKSHAFSSSLPFLT